MIANCAVIATYFVLSERWFSGGGIGCDDSDPPQPAGCERHGDILTQLLWGEVALFALTLALGAAVAVGYWWRRAER